MLPYVRNVVSIGLVSLLVAVSQECGDANCELNVQLLQQDVSLRATIGSEDRLLPYYDDNVIMRATTSQEALLLPYYDDNASAVFFNSTSLAQRARDAFTQFNEILSEGKANSLTAIAAVNSPTAQSAAFALPVGRCHCSLQDLECLPTADCMQAVVGSDKHNIALGAEVRKEIKKLASFQGNKQVFIPLGKCFQYSAIDSWKHWATSNTLFAGFSGYFKGGQDSWKEYEFCNAEKRTDASCFLKEWSGDESPSMGSTDAVSLLEEKVSQEEVDHEIADLRRVQKQEGLPIDTLLSFAHILRIQFNMQPSIIRMISKRAATINPGKGVLRVSLHVRRADACDHVHDHNHERYADAASTLDSGPQLSGKRLCYRTKVYIDKLKQIYDLYKMPLAVYLSTDDSASVIDEIREGDPALYDKMTFHFSNYSRSNFEYNGMIEGNHDNHGFMTESALIDLWTLSHGQIFVGSLGSRFGKVGYLLATARHNRVIPFVTVDGHSLCCEIDEDCAKATPAMQTMEDCLTFAHELARKPANKDYWTAGSTLRYK